MSRIIIDLERILADKGISKNQLCYACKIQHTQLNNYCKNKVVRVDLHTLAKLCEYIDCDVNEILKFEKENEND